MKYAFLVKNFKNLSFEQRVIFLAHVGTALFCFFPWLSIEPLYDDPYWHSAFGGAGALVGAFVFLLSLGVVLYFADKILDSKRISLPFSENTLFLVAGIEQLIFLVLAWSVLVSGASGFESSEIRFGISLAFLAQAAGIMATYLQIQKEKNKTARNFFQHPRKHSVPQKREEESVEENKLQTPPTPIGGLFDSQENKTHER